MGAAREGFVSFEAVRDTDGTYALLGRVVRGFLAGDSRFVGTVTVEALLWWGFSARDVLEVLEMESRMRLNFRLVVLNAYDIFSELWEQVVQRTEMSVVV